MDPRKSDGIWQNNIYVLDYSKAFDCIDHSQLWNTLRSMGVPEHLIVLIKGLYTQNKKTQYKRNMVTQSGLK